MAAEREGDPWPQAIQTLLDGFPSASEQCGTLTCLALPDTPLGGQSTNVGKGQGQGLSTRGEAMQRTQRAQKKKSALDSGVGSGTLGAHAALIALKKGAYLRRGRTSWTVSIITEDDGASSGL
jgi:ribosomal protein L11 methylase PrmA